MTTTPWPAAARLARLFHAAPLALGGGVRLRAHAGPVRDRWLALAGHARRLPVGVSDGALRGEIDLAATLAAGRAVRGRGILDAPGPLVLPSAERCEPGLAGRLGQALDAGRHALVALDEGDGDEAPPPALLDRLGAVIGLDGIALGETEGPEAAWDGGAAVADPAAALAAVAHALGVGSLRPVLAALRIARASAGTGAVGEADLAFAAGLTLAPRATRLPEAPPAEDEAEVQPPDDAPPETDDASAAADRTVEAIHPMLPADLLARLAGAPAKGARGAGAGAARRGNRRGRPLPSRPGRLDGRARLDVVATLRAAAPWQRLRGGAAGEAVRVRGTDLHLRRYESRSDRLVIFAVDASGSTAAARLAEAKGAVEILLSEAYARRDHVALVAFRGAGADLLLPPTRSLARTKRELAALPGGGGTPLAAGLREGLALARTARARGMAPVLVVLTDGRPNVALTGAPGRAEAGRDAEAMAALLRADGVPGLVIDTGARPSPALAALANRMGATSLALPRADARRLGQAVAATL